MKRVGYGCLIILICGILLADVIVTTRDGKSVLLKDNGTWEYVQEDSPNKSETGKTISETPSQSSGEGTREAEQIDLVQDQNAQYQSLMNIGIIVISVLVLLILALVIYFLVLVPAKKRKLLKKAFEIIMAGVEDKYSEAEVMLENAVARGLKGNDISDAYFGIAYINAHMNRMEDALVSLKKCNMDDPPNIHFALWLNVKHKKNKEAYELYIKNQKCVQADEDMKLLASIACLRLGMEKWNEKDIDAATHYFDHVKELEVIQNEVPDTISDYQMTLGIFALYDDHNMEARTQFEKALAQAKKEERSTIPAELALLLCEWREIDLPKIDDDLIEIIGRMEEEISEKTLSVESARPATVAQKQIIEKDVETNEEANENKEKKDTDKAVSKPTRSLTEEGVLYRNVYLWFSISLLYLWMQNKKKSGLLDSERKKLHDRLKKVLEIDSQMGDPRLIGGLVDYYFAYDTERENAIQELEKSKVSVPEVKILIKKEKELIKAEENSLEKYYALAKKYCEDSTIPLELRNEFREKMQKYERFKKFMKEKSMKISDEEVSVTIKDLKTRGDILSKRIKHIVMPKLSKEEDQNDKKEIESLIQEMDGISKIITEKSKGLEKSEQQLMMRAGEFLLNEEEVLDSKKSVKKQEE